MVTTQEDCQLLRVDGPDFQSMLKGVERDTVRLGGPQRDTLVLLREDKARSFAFTP